MFDKDRSAAFAVHMMGIHACHDEWDLATERRAILSNWMLSDKEKEKLIDMLIDRADFLTWKRGKSDQEQIRLQLREEEAHEQA